MNPFPIKYIFSYFLLLPACLLSQNMHRVDSLLKVANNKKSADTLLISAYNDLGIEYASADFDKSKRYIQQAFNKAKETNNKRGMAGAKNCLGIAYYYRKEYDSALACYKTALALNKEVGHYWGQASAMHQIGVIYKFKSEYSQALQAFDKSKNLFQTLKDSVAMAKSIEQLGATYHLMGHHQQGTQYYLQSVHLFERMHDTLGIARSYNHLSTMLIEQEENYTKALIYLDKAWVLLQKNQNKNETSAIRMGQASCYYHLKLYDKALQCALNALQQRELLGNSKTIASAQALIGEIYFGKGDYKKALNYLNTAISNFTTEGDYRSKTKIYIVTAKCYQKLGEIESAKNYALKAITLSKTIKNMPQEKEGYLILASLAEKSHSSAEAVAHYKKALQLNDSISTALKQRQTKELQVAYETQQKEKKIGLQEVQIRLLEEESTVARLENIIYLSALFVFLFFFSLFIYYSKQRSKRSEKMIARSLREKQQLDKDLDFKTRQLVTYALHLSKKNQVLEAIKEVVLNPQHTNPRLNTENLLQLITAELNEKDSWKQFTLYFEQVHNDFNKTVQQRYPDITSKDLRLMALIKMNLSSKEICSLLSVTPEGVKKARYRLRIKMNLQPEESLESLIISL
jgi:tetratricopeptide (TPR) repeat protein